MSTPRESVDIAVVGAGAAGLMAAIAAGRAARAAGKPLSIKAFDGAKLLGAKILVAGGGRCNVTHHAVDETAFAGSTRPAIRRVLGRFTVGGTVAFFQALGVELKGEETGKLFPTTDNARTVLNALLQAAADANVQLRHPCRVDSIERTDAAFLLTCSPHHLLTSSGTPPSVDTAGAIRARRVILATGGKALPRSGSDGHGYSFATALGHTLTPRIFPALVPLTLPRDHFLCSLSGLSAPATLEVRSSSGKRLAAFTGDTLCTHFGLSGPAALDISRYYLDARASDPGTQLVINWLPGATPGQLDEFLIHPASAHLSVARLLTEGAPAAHTPNPKSAIPHLPLRLARALVEHAGLDPSAPAHRLTRDHRRSLVRAVTELELLITGDRGFTHAEVTAGGVPLSELRLDTMESRACPGLYLCGEILDVDGRIGGFNFQWAWASGHTAGTAAATALIHEEQDSHR